MGRWPFYCAFFANGCSVIGFNLQLLSNKRAEMRVIVFHTILCHFASQLLTNDKSLVYVKEQLGHSSIQMTVDIYGHLIPSSNRAAVDRLDETDDTIYLERNA